MDSIKGKILIIDDSEDDFLILKRYIAKDYMISFCNGQENVLSQIKNFKPNCILLDYNLGIISGVDLLIDIKNDSETTNISVIMLTNERKPEVIVNCLKHDATNYLIKDKINKDDLSLAINRAILETGLNLKIKKQNEEIIHLTRIDDLTGVFNRRYFIERLEEEIQRCQRSGGFFSFAVLDLDHFKKINDLFGHLVGDEILRIVGRCLREYFRSTDFVCRYGGDEFILALTESSSENIDLVIKSHKEKIYGVISTIKERVKQYIDAICLEFNICQESNEFKMVTLSIGVSTYRESIKTFEALFSEADKALYHVKESGRENMAYYSDISKKYILFREV
jgi:two-component system cell cycle response regulator